MRKSTIKSLLLGVLMAVGASSAWGQVTTWTAANTTYESSQELSSNVNIVSVTLGDGSWFYHTGRGAITTTKTQAPTTTDGNIPTEGTYFVIKPTKDINFTATSYSSMSNCNVVLYDENGNKLKDFRQKGYCTNDYGRLSSGNTYYLYGTSFKSTGDLENLFLQKFTATSYENYTITYKLSDGTVIKDPVTNSALYGTSVSANSDEAVESIEYNGTSYFLTSGNEAITLTENESQNVIKLIYEKITPGYITINYVSENNTVLKDPVTVSGKDGTEYTVPAEDIPTYLTLDDVKYKYSRGNQTLTFSSDETQTITLIYSEAPKYTYAVKAVAGEEELAVLATGTVVEGDAVSYGYSQYIAKDGVLYKSKAQGSNPWWGGSFTPTADNEIVTINYTAEGTTGVVFCEEGENISTLTPVTGGNTDIRASNRAGGYAASNAVITTLPAGTYKLCAATYGNAGTTFRFNAGGETVLEIATNGNPVHTESEEFTLNGTVDIIVPQAGNAGNSPKTIDYIYIVKTGDVEETAEIIPVTTDAGYTTYVTKNAIEIPSDISAYVVAAVNTNSVALSKVESVPAGTAIIVEAAKGNYDCNIVASAEEPAVNYLKVSNGSVSGNGTIYALAKKDVVGFYPVAEGVIVPAGKAYIEVEGEAPVKGYIALGDEADAINNIAVEAANGAIYNIAGQKMESMKNSGLYIVNGKKVLVK